MSEVLKCGYQQALMVLVLTVQCDKMFTGAYQFEKCNTQECSAHLLTTCTKILQRKQL